MSVNRTPPSTPVAVPLAKTSSSLVQRDIGSMLSHKNKAETSSAKRKYDGEDDSAINSVISEIRIQFARFAEDQDKKFKNLKSSVDLMTLELTKTMENLNLRTEELAEELSKLRNECAEDKAYIKSLEDRLDTAERRARNSCTELRNVSKTQSSEGKSNLIDLVKNLGESIGTEIRKADIKDIYRIPSKKDTCQPIIVEFSSAIAKEDVISSCKTFNRGRKRDEKLNSRHLKLSGPVKPVYVSECLSLKSKRIYYLARDFAKTQGFKYCWTSNGIIYLRKDDNKPFTRISDEQDLKKLMKPT